MGFVLNLKVVDIFLSFSTLIFTPQSNNCNQSYGLQSGQGQNTLKTEINPQIILTLKLDLKHKNMLKL